MFLCEFVCDEMVSGEIEIAVLLQFTVFTQDTTTAAVAAVVSTRVYCGKIV